LGEGLALRSSNVLIHKASNGLKRIVEDHARVLRREKQLLESTTLFLASKIEGVLYGHAHTKSDVDYQPPTAQVDEARKAYYLLHMGGQRDFPVNFNQLAAYTGSGRIEESHTASHFNEMLLPMLGQVKFDYPHLALWIEVRLPDGHKLVYPSPDESRMPMRMRSPSSPPKEPFANKLTWSQPQLDRWTRRAVFSVTAPIRDDKGKLQGDVSIIIPVGSLLHKSKHVDMFSDNARSKLVKPEIDPATNESRLKVVAQEQTRTVMHNHWVVPDKTDWLVSDETEQYYFMLKLMRESSPGVAGIPYKGQDALWAFAPIDESGASLMLIVPKTDIVREAQTAKNFILTQVDNHNKKMGYALLTVAIIVLGISFMLSSFVTRNVSKLAVAVGRVAKGDFSARADTHGNDEIGKLGEAFNQMVPELEERVNLKSSLEVAQEVQQNLLPASPPIFGKADVAAVSEYCDETGGDYFGFIPRETPDGDGLVVTVGDVSGHGVPAALMMSSARAYLRCNVGGGGELNAVIAHVNELICDDVDQSGRFMTLFILELLETNAIRWVRAGHDPAMMYNPANDHFTDLAGDGLPLGVTKEAIFELNELEDIPRGAIIIIGTDGIWEARSQEGEMFGKQRLETLVRDNSSLPAAEIISLLIDELRVFQGSIEQNDDITLAIIKTA
tara:strand:+ start:24607 stop:26619 length:2013 start_codon:yes stop_codon:yes gene_type:complete